MEKSYQMHGDILAEQQAAAVSERGEEKASESSWHVVDPEA